MSKRSDWEGRCLCCRKWIKDLPPMLVAPGGSFCLDCNDPTSEAHALIGEWCIVQEPRKNAKWDPLLRRWVAVSEGARRNDD